MKRYKDALLITLCGLIVTTGAVYSIKMATYADYTSHPAMGVIVGCALFLFGTCGLSLLIYDIIGIWKNYHSL